jgi:hypothetical protein
MTGRDGEDAVPCPPRFATLEKIDESDGREIMPRAENEVLSLLGVFISPAPDT